MKNKVFLAVMCMLALYACKDTPEEVEVKEQPLVAHLVPSYERTDPVFDSLAVYQDSLLLFKEGKVYSYNIDKENSYEDINDRHYNWNYVVTAADPESPQFKKICIRKFQTEFYGPKDQWNDDDVWLTAPDDKSYSFDIKNEISPVRKTFAKYPESKPFPEWVMENCKFYYEYGADTASVPAVIKNAKQIVIKDYSMILSGDNGSVELKRVPLSDFETVYCEGYDWHFITEETPDIPSLKVNLNAGFDFVKHQLKPEERWITLYIDKMGHYDFDFKSWENLVRKVSVCYPTDEEFENTMEEGILPDYSDED